MEFRKLSSLSGTSANDLRRAWQRRSKDGQGPDFLAACTKGTVKYIATRDKAPGASAKAAAASSSIPCRRNLQKSRSAGACPGASSPTSPEKLSTCRRRRSRHGGAPPDAVFRRRRRVTPLLHSSCCWASVARFQRSTASSCNLSRRCASFVASGRPSASASSLACCASLQRLRSPFIPNKPPLLVSSSVGTWMRSSINCSCWKSSSLPPLSGWTDRAFCL
mmetsp:Transcript_96115/g.228919  ORF Transcript_96115/g.228919 Transcript_96115/m.228919 type:complete len:221 (+) Transcript_96115:652-1314(+)